MSKSIQGTTPKGIAYRGTVALRGDLAYFNLVLGFGNRLVLYSKSFSWVLNSIELESVLDGED